MFLSGRRDSNPRPSAWEADALPTELLPLILRYKDNYEVCFCKKSFLFSAKNVLLPAQIYKP